MITMAIKAQELPVVIVAGLYRYVTTSRHQGVADFSPAAVPTAVGAPGAGSGLAGISTLFDEPPQPATAAAENKPTMTIHVKRYRFIDETFPPPC